MHQNQLVKLYNRAPQSTGQAVQQGIRINRSSCTTGHQNQSVKLYSRASESTGQAVQHGISQLVKLYNRASESTGQAVQQGIRVNWSSCTRGHQNQTVKLHNRASESRGHHSAGWLSMGGGALPYVRAVPAGLWLLVPLGGPAGRNMG